MVTEESSLAEEGRSLHGGRILVVDDNEMNRNMLSRRLLRRGYDVEIAEDGRQALAMMDGGKFDLVLLDVMMPEMNGYEVLERLQAHDGWRHVPVIMISAVDEMESIVRCIKLGAADYLPKPFNVTLLGARVEACLARKRLHDREQLYAASLARELEIGRQIQQGFLPAELPTAPGWELATRFLPARQVAGDFYDAFYVGESGHIGLVMADVCDKGVGAALFMALFRSLLRAFSEKGVAPRDSALRQPQLLDTVRATNDYIARTHERASMFATVFFGVLEPASGTLRYINAGHDAPVLVTASGTYERLEPTGPALGLLPDMHFEVRETRLDRGAMLVAFTDGVTDALDADGGFFGEERLMELLAPPPPTAAAALASIEQALETFTAGASPFDDCTLLAVRHSSRE